MTKIICPNCNNYIKFNVNKYDKEIFSEDGKLMGTYLYKEAVCPNCNSYIYIDDIQIDNNLNKYKELRKIANIITMDEMKKIPKRYLIPRKYLNIVLNLNDKIWDNEIPTSKESKVLKEVLINKNEFLKHLQNCKDKIPLEIYENSMKRISKLK